jgi:hypothetical protein
MLFPLHANAEDEAKPQLDRPRSLLNAFEVMCNLNAPDFQRLSAQAAAMRMKVLEDDSESAPAGETVQRKAWVGALTTGPFALRIEKMSGAKGLATSCGIEGPVPDVDAFRDIVIKTLHLAASPAPEVIEGSRTYYWDNYAGDGTTAIVRDMERPSGHFVQVKLVRMVKADAH